MTTGLVGNIQHYSIHDGPGIRSTVFLKGCPLACQWCHNPENLHCEPQLRWQREKCIACGDCVAACKYGAISLLPDGVHIDKKACALCGACVEACPSLALEMLGKYLTVQDVLAVVFKDTPFYESSGGGVTLSGGEPLAQPEFAEKLLAGLKQAGIHTAVDTSGHAPWPVIERCAQYTDLFLYDIKHLDPAQHQRLTGVDNTLILENLRRLAGQGSNIWLRMPLLPGLNDAPEHLHAVGALAVELGIREFYLLPYHHLAMGKYEKLGLTYALPDLPEPDDEYMESLKQYLPQQLNVHIGS